MHSFLAQDVFATKKKTKQRTTFTHAPHMRANDVTNERFGTHANHVFVFNVSFQLQLHFYYSALSDEELKCKMRQKRQYFMRSQKKRMKTDKQMHSASHVRVARLTNWNDTPVEFAFAIRSPHSHTSAAPAPPCYVHLAVCTTISVHNWTMAFAFEAHVRSAHSVPRTYILNNAQYSFFSFCSFSIYSTEYGAAQTVRRVRASDRQRLFVWKWMANCCLIFLLAFILVIDALPHQTQPQAFDDR